MFHVQERLLSLSFLFKKKKMVHNAVFLVFLFLLENILWHS